MRYVLPLVIMLIVAAGCNGKPPVQPENGGEQNGTAPSENGTVETPPRQVGEMPAADEETQARIDELIAKAVDESAKLEERQDAILADLVNIGAIATPDALRLTFDQKADGHCAVWAQKFFRLLPEKEAYEALVLHLYHDDAQMRAAANAMLVTLTGRRDIGYDAAMDEAFRREAIERWKEALGMKE